MFFDTFHEIHAMGNNLKKPRFGFRFGVDLCCQTTNKSIEKVLKNNIIFYIVLEPFFSVFF